MFGKRLRRLACLGLIGLVCGTATTQARDWSRHHGPQYPTYEPTYCPTYNGHLENVEYVDLYSPQHGWRRLPVVRDGQLPPPYPLPAGVSEAGDPGNASCRSNGPWTGYRSFWVPLKDVPLYQCDPRFHVVTPIPKQPPVAPPLPPKPQG